MAAEQACTQHERLGGSDRTARNERARQVCLGSRLHCSLPVDNCQRASNKPFRRSLDPWQPTSTGNTFNRTKAMSLTESISPATVVVNSGIYRCVNCDDEIPATRATHCRHRTIINTFRVSDLFAGNCWFSQFRKRSWIAVERKRLNDLGSVHCPQSRGAIAANPSATFTRRLAAIALSA